MGQGDKQLLINANPTKHKVYSFAVSLGVIRKRNRKVL